MKRTEPHHSQPNCMALFEQLSEYIDRELSPPASRDIEAHIKACKPCQVCLSTLKQTVNLCKHLERRQVPETFSLRLKAAIVDLVGKKPD